MSRMNPIYHHTNEKLRSELEWIQLAKRDPEKFAPLYEKYHEQIFRYIYQRMDDKELAFDVTSQVFLKAMNNLHKYEYRGVPFGSWLYRIAKSELYQAFRDRSSKRAINIETVHLATFMDVFEDEENEINKKRLLSSIAELKEADVHLIEMRFFEQRPYKEMGEILGITENNAKVKTFRALEKLKQLFNQNNR
ncbi:MAG: sigma-70 family RNA polymerase sigma factor [Crocinitomicaceae bacterium]|nr:sigma-70 family RNA polymerase sigma factor [Crocinitomicaceae bacterium]